MPSKTTSSPVVFLALSGAVGCAILFLYFRLIAAEWFLGDDFAFLTYVQRPWSWQQVFFPLERGFWWAYRPLGMDGYFYLCFRLFGWNAQAFFTVTVAAHALTGLVLYRLARQLGFDLPAAVAAALLGVSRFPSITNVTLACTFHYTAAILFHLLALSLFFDHQRAGKRGFQLAACLSFFVGLLCNEMVLNLPFLLLLASLYRDGFRLSFAAIGRALKASWPFFLLAGLFLVYRYLIIAQVERPSLYVFLIGWFIAWNALTHMFFVAASPLSLLAALVLMALMAAALAPARPARRALWLHVARVWALALPWLLGMLLPLSSIPFAMDRFSISAEIPAALLFSALVDALWKAWQGRWRLALQFAIPAVLLFSLPWQKVEQRAASPRGPHMRALQQAVADGFPGLHGNTVLKILYGGDRRADASTAGQYRGESFGGAAIYSRYPLDRILVLFVDVTSTPPGQILCRKCLYLDLLPSYRVEPVSRKKLMRELGGKPFDQPGGG